MTKLSKAKKKTIEPTFLPKTTDRVERLTNAISKAIPTYEEGEIASDEKDEETWWTWHYSVEDMLSKLLADRDKEWESRLGAVFASMSKKKDFESIEEQKGWTDAIIIWKSLLTSTPKPDRPS